MYSIGSVRPDLVHMSLYSLVVYLPCLSDQKQGGNADNGCHCLVACRLCTSTSLSFCASSVHTSTTSLSTCPSCANRSRATKVQDQRAVSLMMPELSWTAGGYFIPEVVDWFFSFFNAKVHWLTCFKIVIWGSFKICAIERKDCVNETAL